MRYTVTFLTELRCKQDKHTDLSQEQELALAQSTQCLLETALFGIIHNYECLGGWELVEALSTGHSCFTQMLNLGEFSAAKFAGSRCL